jgi:hypothetical protein
MFRTRYLITIVLSGSLIASGASADSPLLLGPPAGPYNVAISQRTLTDLSRRDPWHPDQDRSFIVSRFSPISWNACPRVGAITYMPSEIASSSENFLNAQLSRADPSNKTLWPAGLLARTRLQGCLEPTGRSDLSASRDFPIVLFGPALGITRLLYSHLALQLSSTGYTVFALDSPGETSAVQYPDGSVVVGGNVIYNVSNPGPLYQALDTRTDDVSFLLTSLGVPYVTDTDVGNATLARVGYVGHRFGGAAAAAAMVNDTRIVGGMDLDGSLWGAVLGAGLSRPNVNQSFVLWGAQGRNASIVASWATFLATMQRWDPTQWVSSLELINSTTWTLTDLGAIADVAGLKRENGLGRLLGEVPGIRFTDILRAYADSFFGMTLRGQGPGLLSVSSERYPEVKYDSSQGDVPTR